MTEQQLSVFHHGLRRLARPGPATIVEQSPGERTFRTLSGVRGFWALALGGLFISVAHFVLVPAFVVAGIVKGAREDRRLLGVSGVGPRCGVEQRFHVGGSLFDGRTFDCSRCHNNLRVEGRPQ